MSGRSRSRRGLVAAGVIGLLIGSALWLLLGWEKDALGPSAARPPSASTPVAAGPLDQLDPLRIKPGLTGDRPAEVVAVLAGPRLTDVCVKFSPDGRTLALGGTPAHTALWDLAGPEPRLMATCEGHLQLLSALAFNRDGRLLASSGRGPSVRLWDLAGAAPKEIVPLEPSRVSTIGLALAPDGRTVAAAGADQIWVWDTSKQPRGRTVLPAKLNTDLAFCADSRHLLSTSHDGAIRLWDCTMPWGDPKAKRLTLQVPQPGTGGVTHLSLASNAPVFAASTYSGAVAVYELAGPDSAKECLHLIVEARGGKIKALALAPDGKAVATVSNDGALVLWEVPSGKRLQEWSVPPLHSLDFAADGRHLALGLQANHAYIMRLRQ